MRRLTLLFATLLPAATVPANFTDSLTVSGLASPTAMAFAPDWRIFVLQHSGALRVVQNNTLLATPALTLTVDSAGERGLLGIALDPNFATNNFVYLYYTRTTTPRRNRVSRFTFSGNTISPATEQVILDLDPLTSATNHNGGALHFGSDGKLHIAVGDNATGSNSQTLANLHGKMLRINSDGSIPADNPFFSTATGLNRLIWTLGLRNPFTFAVLENTGRIFINDVGQSSFEEINDGIPGANYGWPSTEGPTTNPAFRAPIYSYRHTTLFNGGFSCAITGGDFYQPANLVFPSSFHGVYFFADYCGGWIATFNPTTNTASPFATGASEIVDIRTHPDGSLYYLQRGGGQLRRITFTGPAAPTISTHPQNQTVPAGLNATFSVAANGNNLSYQWQRNSVNIPSANASSYTLNNVSLADSGALFRVIVTNPTGSITSKPAGLTDPTNQPPSASITAPAFFSGGQTISFSGAATDPETGALPSSSLRWRVDYHTGAAVRPFVQEFTGIAGGSFLVPVETPYLLTDVFFRIHLTATDPQGNQLSITRDILPLTSSFTLQTNPAGLTLTADGIPIVAPQTIPSVAGLLRPISAPSPQGSSSTRYIFQNWSSGAAQSHGFTVPATPTMLTAVFSTQHLLSTIASPANAGLITPAGFHNAGAVVPLTATPNAGWQFTGFTGPASGATVLMDSPKTITANFTPLPALLALSILAKTDLNGQRLWTLRISNLGQGPIPAATLTGVQISPVGPGAVALASPLSLPLGNMDPGSSISLPLTFVWPVTAPLTRARITFTFTGGFSYAASITLNNLFR